MSSGSSEHSVSKAAAAAAAQWFVQLQEEGATEHDFQQWQNWLKESPAHRRAYRQIEDAWQLVGEVAPVPWAMAEELAGDRGDGVFAPIADPEHGSTFVRKTTFLYAIAAALLIAVAIALVPQYLARPRAESYATATAEQRSVRLPDGSRVTLGARSKLTVLFEAETRQITLESGEAYFEVAHDPDRPFVVVTGGNAVRAVGTAFNVHAIADRTLVSVVEGRIAVWRQVPGVGTTEPLGQELAQGQDFAAGGGRLLSSGQEALLTSAGGFELHVRPAAEIATWRHGRFEYRGEQLRHVVEDLNRYTDRRIVLGDAAVAALRYSGTVFPDHLDEWLEGIAGALPVRLRDAPDGRYLTSAP